VVKLLSSLLIMGFLCTACIVQCLPGALLLPCLFVCIPARQVPGCFTGIIKYKMWLSHVCHVMRLCFQVQLDASELSGFSVASAEVVQHYKFKNMKAALANIPAGKDVGGSVSTKVRALWAY